MALVWSRRQRAAYVGAAGHWAVYNLMQRAGALAPAVADDPHGWYREGGFEWDEHFPVPDRLEEAEIRHALGGEGAARLPAAQRVLAPARRRLRPLKRLLRTQPRPLRDPPERIEDLSRVEPHREFITGNGFASACRHVLNYDVLKVNEDGESDWWFCKTDWLEHFFRELAPSSPFVLFSSNSDYPIDRRLGRHLGRRELTAWFAVNVALRHPKLHAIPIGIGDPTVRYGHTGEELRRLQSAGIEKTRLLEVSFNVMTNPVERLGCLAATGLELDPPAGSEYLERLASSYFCIAPEGNGIDTHRLWESLYLRTVPVVIRSVLTDQHPDLPLIVLDDWKAFRELELSPELYERVWGSFDLDALSLDRYLDRVREIVGS